MFNDFWSVIFIIFSILPGSLLLELSIFHIDEIYPEMCAKVGLQNSCFLLKLIKYVHFETSWCNWLQIPLVYVSLVEKSCRIYFYQQRSCLHNVIAMFQYIWLHILGTSNQSSAVYINFSMKKVSDSLFWIFLNNIIFSYFI